MDDKEIAVFGKLIEEATLTAQAHAVAMRRLLKYHREVFEKVPPNQQKIFCKPPPPLMPKRKEDDCGIDLTQIPSEEEIRKSLINSGIILTARCTGCGAELMCPDDGIPRWCGECSNKQDKR